MKKPSEIFYETIWSYYWNNEKQRDELYDELRKIMSIIEEILKNESIRNSKKRNI